MNQMLYLSSRYSLHMRKKICGHLMCIDPQRKKKERLIIGDRFNHKHVFPHISGAAGLRQ